MSKFKKIFTLIQHTPLIHFQADQKGATLRATELKPKFDKFLLSRDNNLPFKEAANKHKFLEYKVKIEQNLLGSKKIDSRKSLYFGNMGERKSSKKYKKYDNKFKIEFFTFDKKIKTAIEKHFEAFLANTNFGTRNSKGYGSFYIADKKFETDLIPYKVYSFNSKDWERDVGLFYQFLRQGINLPREKNPFYCKPAIFVYAKSKGWVWDKKVIKENFFYDEMEKQKKKYEKYDIDILNFSSQEKYLLRDIFGLSVSQDWKSYGTSIKKEHSFIERFKSPLTFKVVEDVVYFWVNESYSKILNQEFNIICECGRESFKLKTPQNFDFEEFLDFAVNIDLSRHISECFHNTSEYDSLVRILDSIKKGI